MAAPVSPYRGGRAALATMHGKEAAIAPPFRDILGLDLHVPTGLDTDTLGTFTGEVARPGSLDEVLRRKARLGMDRAGSRLGLASEGSYGPHPQVPFLPFGLEKMIFIDDQRGLSLTEQWVDERPTFRFWEVDDPAALTDPALAAIGFPDQALIVQPADDPSARSPGDRAADHEVDRNRGLAKGLRNRAALDAAIRTAARLASNGRARVETDMRAFHNPRRMRVLGDLACKLARRLADTCPVCEAPGWGRTRVEFGLPCADCGGPSTLVRSEIFGCAVCGLETARPRADGLKAADPGRCSFCNP